MGSVAAPTASQGGHGAVSPETARANARKRREAQRRNEAGRNVFTGLDDAREEAPPPPEVRRRQPEAHRGARWTV